MTAVTQLWPLAIARRSFGTISAGGPFKPIAQGFTFFFEALLSAIAVGNADTLETLSHLDVSTISSTHNDKEGGFPPSTKPVAFQPTFTPEVSACPTEDISISARAVIIEEVDDTAQTVALPVENTSARNSETSVHPAVTEDSPHEDTLACSEDDSAPVESDHLDITYDSEPAVTSRLMESEIAETVETVISSTEEHKAFVVDLVVTPTEPVAADCPPETKDEVINEISEPLQSDTFEENTHSAPEDVIAVTNPTADIIDNVSDSIVESANTSHVISALAELDSVEDTTTATYPTNDFLRKVSDSHVESGEISHIIPQPAMLDDIDYASTTEIKEPIPVPVFNLAFEDDFDAPVSSKFDIRLEHLMGVDMTWSVPQIVEKSKSEREVIRQRLANQGTAQFNPQNLRLEKAARALTINGPVIQSLRKTAALPTRLTPAKRDVAARKMQKDNIPQAEELLPSIHSRSVSASSAESRVSTDAAFESVPCPGTPATDYSGTPTKDGESYGTATEKTIFQQHAGSHEIKSIHVVNKPEELAAEEIAQDESETTN
ncbi:hypothetical protein C7999DRAFT_13120 [Corynascus novoguineensis]|uniref:Uncharacterized protein n=1 Tax=Corynascus novoguineensis TaxID=1126955 RepID=A0AAN7CXD8_9PEZI|nr:hypothetical protein C7999DRAFT_13120 [Corynascus novoguineensis]